jgi:hypothetical protein
MLEEDVPFKHVCSPERHFDEFSAEPSRQELMNCQLISPFLLVQPLAKIRTPSDQPSEAALRLTYVPHAVMSSSGL